MALIKPTLYKQIVTEKLGSKALIKNMAKDIGTFVNGDKGGTISFPRFKRIGGATEVVRDKAKTPNELEQEEAKAYIKHVEAPPIKIYDKDDIEALGHQADNGAKQQAEAIDYKFDLDLADEMDTTVLKAHCADKKHITEDELMNSMLLFGDDRDVSQFTNGGVIIHSGLISDFLKMQSFVNASNTTVQQFNGICRNNCLGYWQGIPVIYTNHGTEVNGEYRTFILKNDAIGYKEKQDITTEDFRPQGLYRTDMYTSAMYAVKLIDEDGCVCIKNSNPATK
ncbi:hypothetical protein G8T75_12865 [Clostridium botulinum D/C]|uniref:hypothetical protein n=1 Tax=Clostridium botulinum TaxID=1491 RepID=UPI001E4C299C|nr:hypothetical protein [Clostridium botulinum]MCD3240849.1 hypothetical protein [Clostridium botulinum D/C]